ncbi:hypothetical protein FB451DRAFT_1235010 [Mycena latifolia]|nr:hypothetical protein FB451DRAFT_1235010 [Mycena latifolia]
MATHDWLSLDLTSRVISASEAAADLRGALPADLFKDEVLKSKFEVFESSISALRSAVVPSNTIEGSHPSPAIKMLAQRAHNTLWDELPLSAIRKAHKTKLEELAAADEDGEPSAEVYVALYKLLQLYQDPKGDSEYRQLKKRFLTLERTLSGGSGKTTSNDINAITPAPAAPLSHARHSSGSDGAAVEVQAPTTAHYGGRGSAGTDSGGGRSHPGLPSSNGKKASHPAVKAEKSSLMSRLHLH